MENQNSKELKYEGMTALVIDRIEDLKEFSKTRFDSLEAYNQKQNGNINKAIDRISNLEKESEERKLTCKAAVEILQKETKYAKFVHWIDNHRIATLLIFLGITIVSSLLVDLIQDFDWVFKLLGLRL